MNKQSINRLSQQKLKRRPPASFLPDGPLDHAADLAATVWAAISAGTPPAAALATSLDTAASLGVSPSVAETAARRLLRLRSQTKPRTSTASVQQRRRSVSFAWSARSSAHNHERNPSPPRHNQNLRDPTMGPHPDRYLRRLIPGTRFQNASTSVTSVT